MPFRASPTHIGKSSLISIVRFLLDYAYNRQHRFRCCARATGRHHSRGRKSTPAAPRARRMGFLLVVLVVLRRPDFVGRPIVLHGFPAAAKNAGLLGDRQLFARPGGCRARRRLRRARLPGRRHARTKSPARPPATLAFGSATEGTTGRSPTVLELRIRRGEERQRQGRPVESRRGYQARPVISEVSDPPSAPSPAF